MKKEIYDIEGMSCTSCSSNIERRLSYEEAIDKVSVNLLKKSMYIYYDESKISSEDIVNKIKVIGFNAKLRNKEISYSEKNYDLKDRNILIITIILATIIMYLSMSNMHNVTRLNRNVQMILTTVVMILNIKYFKNGIKMLFNKIPNMYSLISISTIAAYIYSIFFSEIYFESIAMIIALISIGKYFENKIKNNATVSMHSLINLRPQYTTLLKDNKESIISVEDLEIGDIVIIKSGDLIPCDAIVIEGNGYVDESSLTGESKLIKKIENMEIKTATILKKGYLKAKVMKIGNDTFFAKILELVENASISKPEIVKLADIISIYFVPTIIFISLVTFIYWLLNVNISIALKFSLSVLVISCPCALGLASPLSIFIASYITSKKGILFKNSTSLEILNKIDVILFDKTGTITKGIAEVVDFNIDKKYLDLIYSIEKKSEHILASPIIKYCENLNSNELNIEKFTQIDGEGIKVLYNDVTYIIGNKKMMKNNKIDVSKYEDEYISNSNDGKTFIYFSNSNNILGYLTIRDTLKENIKDVIRFFKNRKIKTIMLTGDNNLTAKSIAKLIEIDEYYSDLLPDEKYEIIDKLQEKYVVAMVGDGINDAPSLIKANVGISIGNATDVAIESADIILTNNNMKQLINAYIISKKVIFNIKLNLFWAFIYNIVGIPIAAGVLMRYNIVLNPMFAAFAMSMSSISVLINSYFLKFKLDKNIN